MLITTIEELRLASPAHALDSIDGMVGFIDNSEHDFLEEKLGTPLYKALCKWYDQNPVQRTTIADYQTGYYNRMLLLCQRCVAFDALGRAVDIQAISVNNSGVNQFSASDYERPDKNGLAIANYKQTCQKEAHAALNQLLRQLEQWCREEGTTDSTDDTDGPVLSDFVAEKTEIVTLWKQSAYYYLAAALLIPSCQVMQQYLNIYDSREKFIQMLPDLQFIQEEQIATAIGEPLMLAVIDYARDGKVPATTAPDGNNTEVNSQLFSQLVHRLRKTMAALLVGRTSVIKYDKEQKIQAHDDGVRMLQNVVEYLRQHQQDFPEVLVKDAPWYVAPEPAPAPSSPVPDGKAATVPCGAQQGQKADRAACWTPPLL